MSAHTNWHRLPPSSWIRCWIACMLACCTCIELHAAEAERKGDWWEERDEESGVTTQSMELTLHPAAEPRPALALRLIADDFDRRDGNSALFYLKAMGFFEQQNAHARLMEYKQEASRKAEQQKLEYNQVPPNVWLETEPGELPIAEVNEYLQLTSFQPWFLSEAARLRGFSLDRNMQDIKQPIAYLLPEIQSFREMARTQSLRCRLAVAENRIEDAVTILGQQFAMANHLSQDEFVVSALVAAAVSQIAWGDALHCVQHPEAPNLYWALASLPDPLIDMQRAYSYERQFLYEQLKVLREVDEEPKSNGYWQDFVDRLLPQLEGLAIEGIEVGDLNDPALQRMQVVAFIAAAYPGAKRYLIEDRRMDSQTVEAYPTAQVVFLAMRQFYDETRDDYFKWRYTPYSDANRNAQFAELDDVLRAKSERLGLAASPASQFVPAINAIMTAQQRVQMTLAMLQTIEAIRAYAVEYDGKLPRSLADLKLPSPNDPFTGQAIDYEFNGASAVLSARSSYLRYRLRLKIEN